MLGEYRKKASALYLIRGTRGVILILYKKKNKYYFSRAATEGVMPDEAGSSGLRVKYRAPFDHS